MKRLIFFVIGAAAGSAVTFFAVRGHYRKLAFYEINEVRNMYKQKQAAKDLADKNEKAKKEFLSEKEREEALIEKAQKAMERYIGNTKDAANSIIKLAASINKEEPKEDWVLHNVFSNPPDPDELDLEEELEDDIFEFEEEEDDDLEYDYPSEGPSEYPFLISEEEFASEKMVYDKVMIELYRDGIAVLEDTDEILDSVEDLIGPDILDRDDLESIMYNGVIYVRNDNRSSDYGIIFKDRNFVSDEDGS